MKDRDNEIFDYSKLQCIATGEVLKSIKVDADFVGLMSGKFICVDSYISNMSETYFYPICNGVIIMLEGFYFDHYGNIVGSNVNSPFVQCENTDKDWYIKYNEIIDFKNKEFVALCDQCTAVKDTLVEQLSSSGSLIKYVKEKGLSKYKYYVAIDLDYYALRDLVKNDKTILAICCNAKEQIFSENSISCVISNSVHHIPDDTSIFYKNVCYSLVPNGLFVGIESQGVYAKFIVTIISFFPKIIIPYFLKEVYNERHLLLRWLKKDISCRLKESGIENSRYLNSYHKCITSTS